MYSTVSDTINATKYRRPKQKEFFKWFDVSAMLSNVIHSLIWVVGILMLKCPAPYAENVFSYEDQKNFTRQFKIQVQRLVCNEAPYKETVLLECRMIFRRNQRSLLCMSLKVPKLYHYVMVQFQLNYKFTTYQTFLIDGKVEGCAYMRHQNNDPVLTYMYGVLKDMIPSVVHPCPLGVSIFVRALR